MKLKNNHKFVLAADGSGASGKTTGAKIISRKYLNLKKRNIDKVEVHFSSNFTSDMSW